MRTTVSLDPDVMAAIERLRAEQGLGLSEALNALARAGLASRVERKPFVQRTAPLGLTVDISNIGRVEELMDQWDEADS